MMKHIKKSKKLVAICIITTFIAIGILISFATIFIHSILTLSIGDNMSRLESMSSNEKLEKFELVLEMLKDGELSVKPNGCITLPDDFKYLSDSGECFVIKFNDKTALEFFLYRGMINSGSKAYVYTTDEISYESFIDTDKYNVSHSYSSIDELSTNLFLCRIID